MIVYTLMFFLVVMLVIKFLVFQPRRRAFNRRAVMLNSIRAGTVVYTADGIRAKVDAVNKSMLQLSCYPDDVRLSVDLESVDRIENYDEQAAMQLMGEKIRRGREKIRKQKQQEELKAAEKTAKKREKRLGKAQNE